MINKYIDYIKENSNNKFEVVCEINDDYLIKISGKKNINDAIYNELNYINTINLEKIIKIKDDVYKLILTVENDILKNTETNNIEKSIKREFNWLDQSGIRIKNINLL